MAGRSKHQLAELQALVKVKAEAVGEDMPDDVGFVLLMFNRGGKGWSASFLNVPREVAVSAMEDYIRNIKAGTVAPPGVLDRPN